MEMTLESALSPGGVLGHASYLLLVVSMVMRRMITLRILVMLSAVVGIAYDAIILTNPVGVFWQVLLVAVNLIQLAIVFWQNRRAQFNAEEAAFMDRHFPGLSNRERRLLLDRGRWEDLPEGHVLCSEGRPVPELVFLQSGTAEVVVRERPVGLCAADSLIGEITVATAAPATATVRTLSPARVWLGDAVRLRRLMQRNAMVGRALEASFFQALSEKLREGNRARGEIAQVAGEA